MTSLEKNIEIPEERIPTFTLRFLNASSLFGIVVFTFSTYMFIKFTSTFNQGSFISFTTNVGISKGTVTEVSDTDFGEGGELSSYPIYEVTFFYIINGRNYFNKGYTTDMQYKVGDALNVKYKLSNPSLAKADGLRSSHYGLYILLGILLPIAGLWIILKGIQWGNNFISILRNGIITEGQFIKCEEDGDDFNHFYQYKDITGNMRFLEHKKVDRNIANTVNIIYYQKDVKKAEVIDWKTLPIVFNRRTLKEILNGS